MNGLSSSDGLSFLNDLYPFENIPDLPDPPVQSIFVTKEETLSDSVNSLAVNNLSQNPCHLPSSFTPIYIATEEKNPFTEANSLVNNLSQNPLKPNLPPKFWPRFN